MAALFISKSKLQSTAPAPKPIKLHSTPEKEDKIVEQKKEKENTRNKNKRGSHDIAQDKKA